MALEVDPAHLPVVSSQLDLIADTAIVSLVASSFTSVVLPPALDAVNALVLPQVTAAYAQTFFSCTGDGFAHREVASASLPPAAAAYSGSDIINAAKVVTNDLSLPEMPNNLYC